VKKCFVPIFAEVRVQQLKLLTVPMNLSNLLKKKIFKVLSNAKFAHSQSKSTPYTNGKVRAMNNQSPELIKTPTFKSLEREPCCAWKI
jgi:hypothetical protein